MKHLGRSISLAALLTAMPLTAFAEEVTVSSRDKTISLTGELMSFDDDTMLIKTDFGELTLERSAVVCEGAACPAASFGLTTSVAVAEPTTVAFLQAMVNGFASSRGVVGLAIPDSNGNVDRIDIQDFDANEQVGSVDLAIQDPQSGFAQLATGGVDFAISTSAVPASIAEGVVAAGQVDLRDPSRELVVALDAIVPVVHPDNLVRSISLEELAQISAGRIRNWSELGGDNAPIRMILPAAGTSLDTVFGELVLEPNRVRLRRSAERLNSEKEAAEAVAADPTAITVTSLANAGDDTILPIRQTCGPLAYPSDFSIKAEEYPLSRRVLMYTAEENPSAGEREFLNYLASSEAQAVIKDTGYVNQDIVSEAISLQGTRMTSALLSANNTGTLTLLQNFSRDLAAADRLSTTFRFTSGSSRLDNKSLEDVERMVDFLNSSEARGRQILVIGFTDDVGRFDLNERLALQRATSVRDALVGATGGDVLAGRIGVSSYGPLAPVGCNDTAVGRESNRRVEVWLR